MVDLARLRAAYEKVRDELLAERTPGGYWVGELSSSALSTATAVSALAAVRRGAGVSPAVKLDDLVSRGVRYLASQQNPDGGFGDTDLSHSNIATTYLVVAALHLADGAVGNALRGVPGDLLVRANAYIDSKGGLNALRKRYGIDKTFVVPIMTNLALAGLLTWRDIDPLPFELACVPQSWYRFVGMPVVSYAIPALVAIGQARYFHAPPRNPLTRLIRWLSISRSLQVLRCMQPDSGGYLEATPLTSFVVMSLASLTKPRPVVGVNNEQPSRRTAGSNATVSPQAPRPLVGALNPTANEVISHGVKFLANSIRPNGSWPIDTNLATWNTTLAINALAGAGEDVAELLGPKCLDWLLSCQHLKRHPFTGADPGGFGWSDLSGAVPDADDTPGALLALSSIHESTIYMEPVAEYLAAPRAAAVRGLRWLLRLQNRDGGVPTFCRGWGTLPFDRSGTDLTAHALRAMEIWRGVFGLANAKYKRSPDRGDHLIYPGESHGKRESALRYLSRKQHPDGSWSPLWFGNQDHPQEDNPVYGTAKVLMAYRDLSLMESPEARRGVAWLVANQNEDGGWGSGVWGRARNSELGARSGVESQGLVTSSPGSDHSVLSTQYSVPSTDDIPNPISKIQNLESSVEETALAVEALLATLPTPEPRAPSPATAAVARGLAWLIDRVEAGQHRQPAPIGFYFAKLWYYERLYPLTFTVAALGRACRTFARPTQSETDRPTEKPGSP